MSKKNIVVIPVYKPNPTEDEIASLRQCIKILGAHPICLVCPNSLDTECYNRFANVKLDVARFDDAYFRGIEGYNKLMKSRDFYERFNSYEYILIYQLDAWVFKDELDVWCDKGYDYIGAPWFEKHKSHEEGYDLWCVGNGGFSLRRTRTFITVTTPTLRLKSYSQIYRDDCHSLKGLWRSLVACLPFSPRNTLDYYMNKGEASWMWEDGFFCYGLEPTRYALKRPSPQQGAFFSFECSPKYLFDEITYGQLPFGCHAWRKYQYEEFWKKYIPHLTENPKSTTDS